MTFDELIQPRSAPIDRFRDLRRELQPARKIFKRLFSHPDSRLHGIDVGLFALAIAQRLRERGLPASPLAEPGALEEAVVYAAFFHDCSRWSDGSELDHGRAGNEAWQWYAKEKRFPAWREESVSQAILMVEVGVRQAAEKKADPTTLRADREVRADRNLLMLQTAPVDRGLGFHSPGPAHGGGQEESALVDEDEVRAQVVGVFLSAASLPSSSARSALRSVPGHGGRVFGNRRPMACNSRPTWSRWYRIENRSSIVSAIRAVVHKSVRYPRAIAPRSGALTSRFFWASVSRDGRPAEAWTS